ncbi:MAG: hypothetical protein ACYS47_17680 [Planctomycetota bacterium]|jgi:hypothetical protein
MICACSTQSVWFKSPEGAEIEFSDGSKARIPCHDEINTGVRHAVKIHFDEDALSKLGFSSSEISELKESRGMHFKGILAVKKAKILSVFEITAKHVRAVLLENKVIYWKYWDENNREILFFEGYPSPSYKE